LDEPLNRQSRVTLVRRDASTNELQVHHAGLIALELAYARPVLGPPLSHDSTPFVDEEDFDICLLIYDVMSNAARRKRIYSRLAKALFPLNPLKNPLAPPSLPAPPA
jgi:hypothetical protein